ncbi:putative nuclear RNA export factor SDE5 isoform X2 [Senna tora]|uniref:Putative nuclear RNA export factor SDE5 isoform X2 n=1 Tax=Senna tora TaxID=362788 RepID=A0A834W412_9FABA|nr:putative nuclear RNA export factor SDE5 isoform X2 [Senna tora]
MEISGQNGFKYDEENALNSLLDAFGSAFSLEEIASAYCKASRNANLAGEILFDMQRSSSISALNSSNADAGVEVCTESSYGLSSENSCHDAEHSRGLKAKVHPVSVGTVSSRLGKDYVKSMPLANWSYRAKTKPLKLDANVLSMSEIWDDQSKPNTLKHDKLHQDMEDFLFKMLGDGFQLDRDKIREVLDNCGYDMQKSMEKLMDESILTSDKKARVVGESSGTVILQSTDMKLKSELPSSERKSQSAYPRCNSSKVSNKGVDLRWQRKERDDLQKELLASLFHVPQHFDESPKRIVKDVKNLSPYRQVVNEPPPEDSPGEFETDISYSQLENIGLEDEDDYQNLRKAVKENRATTKEYFKAAIDEFAKENHAKACRLLEQGQFFLTKAHEADEESNKMIVETKVEEVEEMPLDLHDHGSKEAIRLLKTHLSYLSGIPTFKYLKVIIDTDKYVSKGSRRRRCPIFQCCHALPAVALVACIAACTINNCGVI